MTAIDAALRSGNHAAAEFLLSRNSQLSANVNFDLSCYPYQVFRVCDSQWKCEMRQTRGYFKFPWYFTSSARCWIGKSWCHRRAAWVGVVDILCSFVFQSVASQHWWPGPWRFFNSGELRSGSCCSAYFQTRNFQGDVRNFFPFARLAEMARAKVRLSWRFFVPKRKKKISRTFYGRQRFSRTDEMRRGFFLWPLQPVKGEMIYVKRCFSLALKYQRKL